MNTCVFSTCAGITTDIHVHVYMCIVCIIMHDVLAESTEGGEGESGQDSGHPERGQGQTEGGRGQHCRAAAQLQRDCEEEGGAEGEV